MALAEAVDTLIILPKPASHTGLPLSQESPGAPLGPSPTSSSSSASWHNRRSYMGRRGQWLPLSSPTSERHRENPPAGPSFQLLEHLGFPASLVVRRGSSAPTHTQTTSLYATSVSLATERGARRPSDTLKTRGAACLPVNKPGSRVLQDTSTDYENYLYLFG